MLLRELARDHAAEAVANERDLAAVAAMDGREQGLDAVERRRGRTDIGAEAPAFHRVAAAREEAPRYGRRPAGKTAARSPDGHRRAAPL